MENVPGNDELRNKQSTGEGFLESLHEAELKKTEGFSKKEKCLEEITKLKSTLDKLEKDITSTGKFTTKVAREGSERDEAIRFQIVKRMMQLNSSISQILGTPDEHYFGTFLD